MSMDSNNIFNADLRRYSNVSLSNFTIEEDVVLLNDEEKDEMLNSHTIQSMHVENVLWEGDIFENIQSLRHFKDSKSFVDHVLKTGNLFAVKHHFSENILNYVAAQNKMSQSFSSAKKLLSSHQLVTDSKSNIIDHQICRIASFPRVASLTDKYQNVMDEFINCYFFKPGFELLAGQTPYDWNDNPKSDLFTKILIPKNNQDMNTKLLLHFAQQLNHLWKILYRKINKNVSDQPYRYSFIAMKHPEIFVPGGRFREIYYWDTFWIIQGLLCCGMVDSSIKLVENLVDLVDRYGFVPNGTRKYYLTRSQPPLLALMVNEVYNVTKDKKWLKSLLPLLVKEYKYWTSKPMQISIIPDKNINKQYKFARYYSSDATPRPESYYEDRMAALKEDDDASGNIYCNIRAAAASGWDFSSRWYYDKNGAFGSEQIVPRTIEFDILDASESSTDDSESRNSFLKLMSETLHLRQSSISVSEASDCLAVEDDLFDKFSQHRIQFTNEFSMTKLDTCNVIPVDLNIFLCKVEGYLSTFYAEIGDKENEDKFKSYQNTRINSILSVLWDEKNHQFRDWNAVYKCFGNLNIASNFSPLWLITDHKKFNEKKMLLANALDKSNLICGGGIVTTLYETGEQWDYPNCWAPLNSMIIEGLYNMNQKDFALKLANIWINNNYNTFLVSKKMHEKYHCDRYGTGGGGEYKPQFGFGWTNGVCLKLLQMFGPQIKLKQSIIF